MLTNQDLSAISDVIRNELRNELRKELRKELIPIIEKLKKIDKLEKYLAAAIRLFDSDLALHDKRITRLETRCGIVADEDR